LFDCGFIIHSLTSPILGPLCSSVKILCAHRLLHHSLIIAAITIG
jgi:hypothetical protein